jgi:dTDP-4-dehydrorhamnose reductase
VRVVVIGSKGQLGTDLVKAMENRHEAIGLTHSDIDVTSPESCLGLKDFRPDAVINTAAFHRTDQCEDEPLRALTVNALGARNVAVASRAAGASSVYISTDYVFDGTASSPYSESDTPSPVNAYGISKLAGEFFSKQNERHYVVRVASLFGSAGASGKGGNFVETMISKARRNEPVSVIEDNWMSPTYTMDAAAAIIKVLELKVPFGIYHAANHGFCSWYQFTCEIFKQLGISAAVTPIKSAQFPSKAKRPAFSALADTNLELHGICMPRWEDALKNYLREKGYLQA